MRVQRVLDGAGVESWTVLRSDFTVVDPVEQFLAHLAALDRSPNTTSAYAFDLRDFDVKDLRQRFGAVGHGRVARERERGERAGFRNCSL